MRTRGSGVFFSFEWKGDGGASVAASNGRKKARPSRRAGWAAGAGRAAEAGWAAGAGRAAGAGWAAGASLAAEAATSLQVRPPKYLHWPNRWASQAQ